jgi:hypothetical protein
MISLSIVSMIGFVYHHFGTGRLWLAWTVIALRAALVVPTFQPGRSLHFRELTGLRPVTFLGERVVTGEFVISPWAAVAAASTLLGVVFFIDAAVRLWRKGEARMRRRACVVGVGCALYFLTGLGLGTLLHAQLWAAPYTVSLTFAFFLVALGIEAGLDLLRTADSE